MSTEVRNRCRPALVLSLIAMLSACSDAPESTVAQTAAPAVPAPAATATTSEEAPAELMRRANAAFRENRIVDPSGDNATELFLAARDRDPNHPGLADALVEVMPLAQFAFEAAVRNDDLAESERLHGLIARIDADSAITRSAADRIADLRTRRATALAEAQRLAAASATSAADARTRPQPADVSPALATSSAAAPPRVTVTAAAPALSQPAVAAAAPAREPAPVAATPSASAPTTAPTSDVAAMTAPQPISKIAPDYPPQARSRRVEGFVELEFRVATNGNAEDIRVLRSQPEGLFDRNAVRALMRWKFKPAERNGVPEAATTRTTMNFRQS